MHWIKLTPAPQEEASPPSVKPEDIDLTPADIKNGWTRETLAEHLNQTHVAEHTQLMERIFPKRPKLVTQNCFGNGGLRTDQGFDPHEW